MYKHSVFDFRLPTDTVLYGSILMEIGKNKCGMKKCTSNRMTEVLGRTS